MGFSRNLFVTPFFRQPAVGGRFGRAGGQGARRGGGEAAAGGDQAGGGGAAREAQEVRGGEGGNPAGHQGQGG